MGCGAVKVVPPIAHEVLLVEDGSVGAEERILLHWATLSQLTDVEDLAAGFLSVIGVVSRHGLVFAQESGVGDFGEDWEVFAGHSTAGNAGGQKFS